MSMIEIRNIAAKQMQLKKVTNPTVQRASRKVTKSGEEGQKALVKNFVRNFFPPLG